MKLRRKFCRTSAIAKYDVGKKKKNRDKIAGVFKMPQNLIHRSVSGMMQAYIRNAAGRQLRMK